MEDKNKGLIQLDPDTELIHRQKTNYLIGKVILSTTTYPLSESTVKRLLVDSWKCLKDFTVKSVSHNTFIFNFMEHHDCMHVLLNVPWNVRGGLLILSPWIPGQKPEDFNFSFSPFWVQVHQLPPEFMTPENGVKIGKVLGDFIYSEKHITGPSGKMPAREFLRLRVFLDIRKPLLSKYLVNQTGMSDFWIHFRYEELGIYCYKCGIIGNYQRFCEHPFGEKPRNYFTPLSVPSCSETPAIRVPQMFTIIKRSPVLTLPTTASEQHMVTEDEESSEITTDTDVDVSTGEPQMNTMLKEPSDSGQEVGSLKEKTNEDEEEEEEKETEEESSDPEIDTNENTSTRVPEMSTMVKESSRDLGQEILCFLKEVSEQEKDLEKESSEQMFDSDENFSTSVPQMNIIPTESAESDQEDDEKEEDKQKEDSEEESSDQMFDANENFPTWSGMEMLVMNGLATMIGLVWSRLRVWFRN